MSVAAVGVQRFETFSNSPLNTVLDSDAEAAGDGILGRGTVKLGRLRLRDLSAHDEFLLAAPAKNLRQVAKKLLMPKQEHQLAMS